MKKTLALTAVLTTLILGSYALQALTAQSGTILSATPNYDRAEVERLIGVFEGRTATSAGPSDLAFLGNLYLLRSQWTYELADLESARINLELAAGSHPDVSVLTSLAQTNLGLHDFIAAKQLASDVVAVDPTAYGALAIAIDAQLAVGDFAAAGPSIDLLESSLPDDPAVAIRSAQRHFLTGSGSVAVEEALRAVEAAEGAGLVGSDLAFYRMVAGRFLFEQGQYAQARKQLEAAVELDSRRPGSLYELGRLLAAEGELESARGVLEQAASLLPDPTTLALLGDVLSALGDESSASLQYETIAVIADLGQVAYRRPIVAAWVSRGLSIDRALAMAKDELDVRPDPTTSDVYAMALFRAGRITEAYVAIQAALGPADARILYHAGIISEAAGQKEAAAGYLSAALALNPRFHPLEADDAARLLADLQP
jgi:tetratricopeptide (TPR) repeat protein